MFSPTLLIPLAVLLPLTGALALSLPLAAWNKPGAARQVALGIGAMLALVGALVLLAFDFANPAMQMTDAFGWLPTLGLSIGYGVDGVSVFLVLILAVLTPVAILAVDPQAPHQRGRCGWLLALSAAMMGAAVARDALFFYACFELALLPTLLLMTFYGHGDPAQRAAAARRYFYFNFTGSLLTLAAILYVGWRHAQLFPDVGWTFDIPALYATAEQLSLTEQTWLLVGFLAGFGLKAPLVPAHGWLPTTHAHTPADGSADVLGLVLKLGPYALLRFAVPLCPDAIAAHGDIIATLACVGVLYGGLIAWVQKDFKQVLAYSSISHMGFAMLGILALDPDRAGMTGAAFYVIGYAAAAAGLFLCVGLVQQRLGTRKDRQVGGLFKVMPVLGCFTVLFAMASVGLPGLSGFPGEFLTMIGTFNGPLGWPFAAAAALGVIVAAMYLLAMVGRLVFGPLVLPAGAAAPRDLRGREVLMLAPLAALCVLLGLFPQIVLGPAERSLATFTPGSAIPLTDTTPKPTDEIRGRLVDAAQRAD